MDSSHPHYRLGAKRRRMGGADNGVEKVPHAPSVEPTQPGPLVQSQFAQHLPTADLTYGFGLSLPVVDTFPVDSASMVVAPSSSNFSAELSDKIDIQATSLSAVCQPTEMFKSDIYWSPDFSTAGAQTDAPSHFAGASLVLDLLPAELNAAQHWPLPTECLTQLEPNPIIIPQSSDAGMEWLLTQPDPTVLSAKESSIVCFGMITNIFGRCDVCLDLDVRFDVRILASDKFEAVSAPAVRGRIKPGHGPVIQGLLDDESVIIHVTCVLDQDPKVMTSNRRPGQVPCALTITVYGPVDMFEEIGEWAQDYDIYLQDPLAYHCDVKYYNPHKLASSDLDNCPMLSNFIVARSKPLQMQELPQLPDILQCINSHIDLEETPTPRAIRTDLKRHQKQALTFMRRRETGWAYTSEPRDMWELLDNHECPIFLNRVSGSCQTEEPTSFHGGIVADPMGFGKTLTMIALVAAELGDSSESMFTDEDRLPAAATLVVVPPPRALLTFSGGLVGN